MATKKTHDLYTFVAGAAIEKSEAFFLKCNCGGTVTIMPPFQEESVICPSCESSIGIHVVEGDPSCFLGLDPKTGKEFLIHVQGSSAIPPHQLPEQEREEIISKFKENLEKAREKSYDKTISSIKKRKNRKKKRK
jgi:hypothetical protein